jgi:hypothetical protein
MTTTGRLSLREVERWSCTGEVGLVRIVKLESKGDTRVRIEVADA